MLSRLTDNLKLTDNRIRAQLYIETTRKGALVIGIQEASGQGRSVLQHCGWFVRIVSLARREFQYMDRSRVRCHTLTTTQVSALKSKRP